MHTAVAKRRLMSRPKTPPPPPLSPMVEGHTENVLPDDAAAAEEFYDEPSVLNTPASEWVKMKLQLTLTQQQVRQLVKRQSELEMELERLRELLWDHVRQERFR